MEKTIDYYFSPSSPWSFLGHDRLTNIARKHFAKIKVKPIDFGKVFPATGGVPVAKRAPERQAYRLAELARWQKHLGIPFTLEPKFFPYDATAASLLVLAATSELDDKMAMLIASAIFKGCWVEERDMGDPEELLNIVKAQGLDAVALVAAARSEKNMTRYAELTDEAMAKNVFGAPSYVYRDELFWGQDRLDFLDRALED